MEFATGSIGLSMGTEWQEIDAHPTRVRLPDEPLMLVDRILSLPRRSPIHDQRPGRHRTRRTARSPGTSTTAGSRPASVSKPVKPTSSFPAYLGIDFETSGLAMYPPPRCPDYLPPWIARPRRDHSLRYPYRTLLPPGRLRGYFASIMTLPVKGQPLLTMRNGLCGLFYARRARRGRRSRPNRGRNAPLNRGVLPADWRPLVPMQPEQYSDDQVAALRRGDYRRLFRTGLREPRHKTIPSESPTAK